MRAMRGICASQHGVATHHQEDTVNQNVNVSVINPGVGINRSNEAIYIQFELMDELTQEGTGKTHTVLMPTPEAMMLLRLLERVRQTFALDLPPGDLPPMAVLSEDRKN